MSISTWPRGKNTARPIRSASRTSAANTLPIHSGQGDGRDLNRPSMSSILVCQGKIYLTAPGIGINEIEGLEVRPLLSPHPVETSILGFRAFGEGRYLTYSHLGDIASFKVMRDMIDEAPA